MTLFETMRVVAGKAELAAFHEERMENSARVLGIPFSRNSFRTALDRGIREAAVWDGRCRVRLDLSPEAAPEVRLRAMPLETPPAMVSLILATGRVSSRSETSGHKVSPRGSYGEAQREAERLGYWDGLLRNDRGEVTECGRANIILLLEGGLVTPPRSAGLLPGTVRRALLEAGTVREGRVTEEDLGRASAAFVTNAIVGVAGVSRVMRTDYHPRWEEMMRSGKRLSESIAATAERLAAGPFS